MNWNKERDENSIERFKIFDYANISPKAQDLVVDIETVGILDNDLNKFYSKYPFIKMTVGQAFYVIKGDDGMKAPRHVLESAHRNFSKKNTGKYFRVIWHKDHNCFEVVRIR